jgi:hypothetical protein
MIPAACNRAPVAARQKRRLELKRELPTARYVDRDGHAAAVPHARVMNSRRFNANPARDVFNASVSAFAAALHAVAMSASGRNGQVGSDLKAGRHREMILTLRGSEQMRARFPGSNDSGSQVERSGLPGFRRPNAVPIQMVPWHHIEHA